MFNGLVDALKTLASTPSLLERRGHYRVPCRRPVNMLLKTKGVGGHMINLSPSGMKVRSREPLPRNREMRLVVSGSKNPNARFVASIDLICRVVWSKYSQIHDAYDSGLAYIPAPGVDLQYIDAFFRHELGLEDLETFQRRASRRVSVELDVTCFTPDGRVSLGAIRDVSLDGAQFEGSLEVEPDSEVRLRVETENEKRPVYCVGRVVRCQPTRRAGWFEIGVSFTEVGNVRTLKQVIAKELRAKDRA